jgi:hypothetical protein
MHGDLLRFDTKVAALNPPAAAFENYEGGGADIRSVDTVYRATIPHILYKDFIGTNGFKPGRTEQSNYTQIYAAAEKQSKMLSGLRRSLSAT